MLLCRPLLLAGGVDSAVRIYVQQDNGEFEFACFLKGHENWVRGIAAVQFGGESSSAASAAHADVWIATASQDRMVRVWRLTADTGEASEVRLSVRC